MFKKKSEQIYRSRGGGQANGLVTHKWLTKKLSA